MQSVSPVRFSQLCVLLIVFFFTFYASTFAQSRPQKSDTKKGDDKRNKRPVPKTEEELKKEEEKRKQEEEEKNAVVDDEVLKIKTNVVNVDAVVYNKKSGQIVTGLKKENFAVFENGIKQDITNFATPEAPITVSVVVEYSKWSEVFGSYASRGQEAGKLEVIRPVAYFLSKFIRPPDDYASVIAFDIRPTPITDFTNDPNRLRQTVDLLLRNSPAFRENNLFDSLKFALVGGKGDSVVLENSKERTSNYGGMINVQAKRRAIILVASGINTFSRSNYDEVRKVIQNAGVPIYILSTGNLFYKLYENQLSAEGSITGMPGRLDFLQAQNAMNTFAKESGGAHFPVTFPGEIPSNLQTINSLLRNQYSIAYDADEKREAGKKYKLQVKVDVNGDGVYEEKEYVIQHRPFFTTPKEPKAK
ncbi:MAG TPA: VWA domain-containing protein [Pyrinomonadaceae bacterium]|nr:VWA domain-containing protein [Pyrinomonadaceae bacterium]